MCIIFIVNPGANTVVSKTTPSQGLKSSLRLGIIQISLQGLKWQLNSGEIEIMLEITEQI